MIAHLVATVAGVGVMAAPSLFDYTGVAADVDHIVGPLIAAFGLMAASQILRALRWANICLALILLGSLIMSDRSAGGALAVALSGFLVGAASFVRGRIKTSFGGGWSSLWNNGNGETG